MVKIISFLQTFTIILVVVGHCFIGEAGEEPLVYGMMWIYSFHMPMFILLSGWLFSYKYKDNLYSIRLFGKDSFVVGKVRRLLVPYFLLSSIVFLFKPYLSNYAARPIGFTFDEYLYQLLYPYDNVMGQLWFLPTLFFIFLIVVVINKLLSTIPLRVSQVMMLLVFLICSLLFKPLQIEILNISGILHYLFYFQLGVVIQRYEILEKIGKTKVHVEALLLLIASVCLLMVPPFVGDHQVAALIGIVFSICLGYIYLCHNSHFLDHLHGASYTIYLFSWFPQVICNQLLLGSVQLGTLYFFVLSSITGVYIPWLIYQYEIKGKKTFVRSCLRVVNGMKP